MFRRQNYDFTGGIYIAFFPTFQAHSEDSQAELEMDILASRCEAISSE